MEAKTIHIPMEILVNLLKSLNDREKNEIFEKVFIDEENEPLSEEEKESVILAEQELKDGKTISWPFGT
jgi:hypothetical protein